MDHLELPLHTCDGLPDALLSIGPADLRQVFPEPTLVHLAGRGGAPLFLSCLLHGNETSSFFVLQRLARWLRRHQAPRPILIFIGNVHAVEAGRRHLDGQPDFNRIWAGGSSPEHRLAARVLETVRAASPFAAIDIHNNNGRNPHYACLNRLDPASLHLASLFSPRIVYFDNPASVLSMAVTPICPTTTLEAGQPGDPEGIEKAFDLVLDTLHLSAFRTSGFERPLDIYETIGRMEIRPEARFAFSEGSDADIVFPEEMESWNFSPQTAGQVWARLKGDQAAPLRVYNAEREDITDQFFARNSNQLVLRRPVTPSMINTVPDLIRDDCLGYLMATIDPDGQPRS